MSVIVGSFLNRIIKLKTLDKLISIWRIYLFFKMCTFFCHSELSEESDSKRSVETLPRASSEW